MRFEGTHVLLTGGTGFIGGVVARRLREEGAKLTCLVRPGTDASRLELLGARILRGDVTQPESLDFAGQHVVIHAAAWVGFGLPRRKLELFERTNVGGTRNVCEAAAKAGVGKIVHVSSIAALGATAQQPATEETPRQERYESVYARTKTEAHRVALSCGVPCAVPMPGLVLGREGPFDALLRRVAHGRLPALPADDAVKGFVHVEDTAEGILQAAVKGDGPYLLVDENVRLTELLVMACEEAGVRVPRARVPAGLIVGAGRVVEGAYKLAGRTPPISGELLQGLRVPMSYDASRARKELGWRPRLVERLAADLVAYRSGG